MSQLDAWREIGKNNFRAALALFRGHNEQRYFRSAVSRFYYAAFCVLTAHLKQAGVSFAEGQETPSHKGLPKLVKLHLALPQKQQREVLAALRRLYSARIAADYQLRTTNESVARAAMHDCAALFDYSGAEHD